MLMVSLWSVVFGVLGLGGAGFIMRDLVGAKGQVAELGTEYLRVILGGSFSIFFLLQVTDDSARARIRARRRSRCCSSQRAQPVPRGALVYGPGDAPPVFAWGPPIAARAPPAAHGADRRGLGHDHRAHGHALCRCSSWSSALRALRPRPARRARRSIAGEIYRIAWPSSTQLVVRILAMLVVHALVARAFTTQTDQTATTALGIVFRLETMALFVGLGWGSAAQTFVGQNLGAGNEQRAALSGWVAAVYNLCAMTVLMLVYRSCGASPSCASSTRTRRGRASRSATSRSWRRATSALGVGIVLGSAMTGARRDAQPRCHRSRRGRWAFSYPWRSPRSCSPTPRQLGYGSWSRPPTSERRGLYAQLPARHISAKRGGSTRSRARPIEQNRETEARW